MKRRVIFLLCIIYVVLLVGFRLGGEDIRDTLSYPVDVTNIFVYSSDTMDSLYTLPDECIYTAAEGGEVYVYILDSGAAYDDGGYYIMPYSIYIRDRAEGYTAVGGIHDELVVVTPVTEDMIGKRAVIAHYMDGPKEETDE